MRNYKQSYIIKACHSTEEDQVSYSYKKKDSEAENYEIQLVSYFN